MMRSSWFMPLLFALILIGIMPISQNQPLEGHGSTYGGKNIGIKSLDILSTHDPVMIENDTHLLNISASEGWRGNGTSDDPVIISNLTIDAEGNADGIRIANTTLHVIMENISIMDPGSRGIKLVNLTNITIEHLDVSNCTYGMDLELCSNIGINNSSIMNSSMGSRMTDSDNLTICNVSTNGIRFTDCIDCSASECSMTSNHISNGIILEGCRRITLSANNCSGCYEGIYCISTYNCEMRDNNCSDCANYGIRLGSDCSGNRMVNNECNNNGFDGMNIFSGRVSLIDNILSGNGKNGIQLGETSGTRITSNKISGNPAGIRMNGAHGTWIQDNEVTGNSYGMSISSSDDIEVRANTISDSDLVGIGLHNCHMPMIGSNILSNPSPSIHVTGSDLINLYANEIDTENDLIDCINIKNCINVQNIIGNEISGGRRGISLENTTASFEDNEISDSSFGIWLRSADHTWLAFNEFERCGLYIDHEPDDNGWLDTLYMDETNTVNGRPLIFLNRTSSESQVRNSTGQIVIVDRDDVVIEGIYIAETTAAVQLYNSSNIYLKNVTVRETGYGVLMGSVSGSEIVNCDIRDTLFDGISVIEGQTNTIRDSVVHECTDGNCISVRGSEDNLILNNILSSAKAPFKGVSLKGSERNRIRSNAFIHNNDTGKDYDPNKTQAADIDGASNMWNSSKGLGNFWTDLRGPDENDDGIVDFRYYIGGGQSEDLYPLTTHSVVNPPVNLSITPGGDFIFIDWDEPFQGNLTEIREFRIYRGPDKDNISFYGSIDSTDSVFQDEDVEEKIDYHYFITAVNDFIESEPSDIVHSVIDPRPPFVNITSPDDGSAFSVDKIEITWEGWDNETGIVDFEVSLDSSPWKNVELNTSYLLEDLEEGSYEFKVRARDRSYRYGMDTVDFVIDRTMPMAWIDYPEPEQIFNYEDITFLWTGFDEVSGIDHYLYTLDDGKSVQLEDQKRILVRDVQDGDHVFVLKAVDRAGNEFSTSVNFTVDTTAPNLKIISPADGMMTSERDIQVLWTGADSGTGLKGFSFDNGDGQFEFVANVTDRYLWQLVEGNYTIRVKAEDIAGNVIFASSTFTIDTTPPEIDIVFPGEGTYFPSRNVTVEWRVNDPLSGLTRVEYRTDGGMASITGGSAFVNLTGLEEGEHGFVLEASDGVGNRASLTRTFHVDLTPPEVSSYGPKGTDVSPDEVIFVSFKEPINRTSFLFRIEGAQGSITWKGDRAILIPYGNLDHGETYEVSVSGTDRAGNPLMPLEWSFTTTDIGVIKGNLVNGDGDPVSNAVIYLDGVQIGRSREDGTFSVEGKWGSHLLTIEADGYETVDLSVNIEPGKETILDLIVMSEVEKEGSDNLLILILVLAIGASIAVVTVVGVTLKRKASGDPEWEE